MKRYLIFTYDEFYPQGGMYDFNCSVNSLIELDEILKKSKNTFFQVWDCLNEDYQIEETYISDYIK